MQAKERILHSSNYMMLCQEDDSKTQWNMKQIVVTQYSFMAFTSLDKLFDFSEVKVVFYQHDCFYVKRAEFIKESEMEEKEQVGCLHKDYQFIIVLMDRKSNSFNLMGCKEESKSRELTKAIQLANRLQEMTLISKRFRVPLFKDYLNFMVQSCNCNLKFFEIKKDMLVNPKQFKILKHFIARSDLIEHLSFKNFQMNMKEIDLITSLIVILPQNQVKSLRFINCKLTDDTLPLLGRGIKHNGFLDFLSFENAMITDKSLRFFSGLWQYVPFLVFFTLKKCRHIKGEIYFSSFLERISMDLQIKYLNLSHNSLSANILTHLNEGLFPVRNLTLEIVDLSFNKITPRENWNIYQSFQNSDFSKIGILIIKPYPMNKELYDKMDDCQKSLNLKLSRMTIKHPNAKYMLNKNEISRVKELKEELEVAILYKRSIESIYALCKTISELNYDYPPQYIENIVHFLRETMGTAEDTTDYYAYYYALEASKMLEMNQRGIEGKSLSIKNKADSFSQQLTRLLNFQIPETQVNVILDELVEKAIKWNYRGHGIDLLFYLKYKRDMITNRLLKKKVDGTKIELELMQKDPFFMLHYDEDYAERTRDIQSFYNKNHDYLGVHIAWMPYELVSTLTKNVILMMIEKVSRIPKATITEINENKFKRCKFLMAEPDTPEYEEVKSDSLMKIARAVQIYRYKKSSSEINFRKVPTIVLTFLEEFDKMEEKKSISGVASKLLNSRSRSATVNEDGSIVPSVKLSRKGSIKSFTQTQNFKNSDAGEELTAVIDFMTVNQAKNTEGSKTPQPQTSRPQPGQTSRRKNSDDFGNFLPKATNEAVLRQRSTDRARRKLSEAMIQKVKLPFSYDFHDTSTGLKVNSFIIKICRLDFFRQRTTFIKRLREFLILGRGEKRVDFRHLLTNESHIIGEMFLGLIRFIHNYTNSISPKLVSNGINLLCFLSFYFKLPKQLAAYTLRKFHDLNYNVIKEKPNLKGKEIILQQGETFMSNLLDKLQTDKFWVGKGFEPPQDETITELFLGGDKFVSFNLLIVAKKIKSDLIRCKETQYVYQFVKEISETEYLFEGMQLDPDAYWLYLEAQDNVIPDIPCNWDWTMKRVRHLLEWMRSYTKKEKFRLSFKRRIWTIRYRSSLERFTSPKINTVFYEMKRIYLVKNFFNKFVKLDKIVEISYILGLIDDIQRKTTEVHLSSGAIRLQKTIPEGSIHLLSESEWIRRIQAYKIKNPSLQNHTIFSLKKKFLHYFTRSPCFCSNIYRYEILDPKKSQVKKDGTLCVNIYGIYFFEKNNFEIPSCHYKLEQVRHIEVFEDYVYFRFMVEKNKKVSIFDTKLLSLNKEDIAFDLVSYMIISMREPKKMFYAYNFLSQFLLGSSKYSSKGMYTKSSEVVIFKCNEEIARLRNVEINLKELAHTKEYNTGIEKQASKMKWSMYSETVAQKEEKERKMMKNQKRKMSTSQISVSGIMKKKRRTSKSWGYSRMNSIRLADTMGTSKRNFRAGGGNRNFRGMTKVMENPTPTQAALEFVNNSMSGAGVTGELQSRRKRPSISPHVRNRNDQDEIDPQMRPKIIDSNKITPKILKEQLMRQKLIEEEEYVDQFDGYDESEIYGGPEYESQKALSRKNKLIQGQKRGNISIPRLDIGGQGFDSRSKQNMKSKTFMESNHHPILELDSEGSDSNKGRGRSQTESVKPLSQVSGGGANLPFDPKALMGNPMLANRKKRRQLGK